jgi:hypothetical protein
MPRRLCYAPLLAALVLGAGSAVSGSTAAAAEPVNFYVSPTGSDANAGISADAPFQTLQKAQSAVRSVDQAASGPVTVNLAGGFYRLGAPLRFGAEDSGTNGTVWWKAEPGAFPVISGGVRLTGWHVSDSSKNIWAAAAPANLDTRQLYVNGVRAQRAAGTLPVTVTQTSTGYTTSSTNPMAKWRNPGHIEFVYRGGLGAWTEPRCPIASISAKTITMAQPCWDNSTKRVMRTDGSGRTYELVGRQSITESPTSVENSYELLDSAGEWYLDPSSHTVYYKPRSGEDLSTADVEAPALQSLLASGGDPAAETHNVGFQGLQFSYATNTIPNSGEGFSEIQATYTITGPTGYKTQGLCTFVPGGTCPYGNWTKMPANVAFGYAHNVHFDHDYFVHLGGAGLDLGDGAQNDTVTACVFTDISGNGLDIGGVDVNEPSTAAQHTSGNVIKDSHFYGTSNEFHGGVAIDVGYAETTTVTHNQIDHVPYTGISVGWGGWPDKVKLPAEPNYSNHNAFTSNLIFDHMSLLADGGSIYTNGITGTSLATGEHITGNLAHDQLNASGGHGLYTDNGASYVTLTGNAEYNVKVSVWGSNHTNYTLDDGTYDPLDIENNYWTKGPSDYNAKSVLIAHNHNISGASQVPSSITGTAGIESQYRSILDWVPAG